MDDRNGTSQPTGTPAAAFRARSRVPAWMSGATEAAFTKAGRLRRARVFHPAGEAFYATVVVRPHAAFDLPAEFPPGARLPAVVRLSKGAGLPGGWPDALGFALRVLDLYGSRAHQDFLLTSSAPVPFGRYLVMPSVGFDRIRYSSLTRFRLCGRVVLFSVTAQEPSDQPVELDDLRCGRAGAGMAFTLSAASPLGGWQPLADVHLGERVVEAAADVAFDPWNTGPQVRPIGFLNHLRAPAYVGSRRGRGYRTDLSG